MTDMEPVNIPARRINKIETEANLLDSRVSALETGFAALAVSTHAITQAIADLSAFLESRPSP